MKFLPTDVSTFSKLIDGNYIYVDKTKYIYDLLMSNSNYFFLVRPRRFGKSLLISTFQELFSGNKELFKDQWIYASDYDWQEYIVLNFDFLNIVHDSPESLKESLSINIDAIAVKYNVKVIGNHYVDKFSSLLDELGKKKQIVLLIDEYDQPIVEHIGEPQLADNMRKILKKFYDVVKSKDKFFKFILVTGVTKFSKTSVVSGLNNLNDITLKPIASKLLGYTTDEIEKYFNEHIEQIEKQKNISKQQIFNLMQQWYNGYRFSSADIKVYNPYSILYYLTDKEFKNYWFQTGMPTILIKLARNQIDSLEDFRDVELSEDSLGTFDIEHIPIVPLLFQTGYLTISKYNTESGKFKLDYPNKEIYDSFNEALVVGLAHTYRTDVQKGVAIMSRALRDNNIESFCNALKSLFAHIPYNLHISQEKYFHSLFQFLGVLLGLDLQSEMLTDKGRVDLVLKSLNRIYIFELKFNISAQDALQQIEDLKYFEKYLIQNKQIILVGLSFSYENKKLNINCASKIIN